MASTQRERIFYNVQRHTAITFRHFAASWSYLEPVALLDQLSHAEDRRSHVRDSELCTHALTFRSEPHAHSPRAMSFNHVSLCIMEHATLGRSQEWLMRSSSGTRVRLHHCQPGFVRFVHSMHSRRLSRLSLRSRQLNGLDSLTQLLGLLQLEVCFLGPSSASGTGLSCVPTCHSTHTRQQNRKRLSTRFLSLHRCLSCPCLSPCLSLSCPSYPFPSCHSLVHCPSALTCQGSCAAQGHHRFSVPASTFARKHARLGKTHDLPREPLSGDHGKLPAPFPSQSPLGPPAGGLYLRQFCTVQCLSPRKQACHQGRVPSLYIFSHLVCGLKYLLRSAAVRLPSSPSYSSLSSRHASDPKRRGIEETRDRA